MAKISRTAISRNNGYRIAINFIPWIMAAALAAAFILIPQIFMHN